MLRETAELKGEVSVAGRLNYLEVQNAAALRDEVQQPLTDEEKQILAGLGI